MKYKVRFIKPSFPDENVIKEDYKAIIKNNWYTNFGPFEDKFRKAAANYISTSGYASTVSNATLGIDVAIKALFKKTDKCNQVIVPSFTFAAGPEMIISNGYKIVFIDIEPKTWQPNINIAKDYLAKNSDKVSGILLCNTFGVGNPRVSEWEELASEYSLPLIIDSAAGFGSNYNDNEKVGLRGDCEIFSFHATKPLSIGEGGLIMSKNPDLIKTIRSVQNFGFDSMHAIAMIGTNAKLQELNCAIGIRQLDGFAKRLNGRKKSLIKYKQSLEKLGFEFQFNDEESTVPFASILAPNSTIATSLIKKLNNSGIEARKYYVPLHKQKIFKHSTIEHQYAFDVTEDLYSRIIALPVHDNMSNEHIELVISEIVSA